MAAGVLRHLDVENIIGERVLTTGLTSTRIAKSLKFCRNFDAAFVEDVTPPTGLVEFVIPKGTVHRVVEYAYSMSFDMAITALVEGRIFLNGKLVDSHLQQCAVGDTIDLYHVNARNRIARLRAVLLHRLHCKKRGRRSLFLIGVRRRAGQEVGDEEIRDYGFINNLRFT